MIKVNFYYKQLIYYILVASLPVHIKQMCNISVIDKYGSPCIKDISVYLGRRRSRRPSRRRPFRARRGRDAPGNNLRQTRTKNRRACARQCLRTRRCRGFVFSSRTRRGRNCFIKRRIGRTRRRPRYTTFISMFLSLS